MQFFSGRTPNYGGDPKVPLRYTAGIYNRIPKKNFGYTEHLIWLGFEGLEKFLKSIYLIARKHNKLVLKYSLILNLHAGEFLLTKYGELWLKLRLLAMKDRKLIKVGNGF